jgi:hypothetical protein
MALNQSLGPHSFPTVLFTLYSSHCGGTLLALAFGGAVAYGVSYV